MPFELEILEERKNPLIDRTEFKVKVDHFGEGTPNRLDVRKKFAASQNAKEMLTIIKKIKNYYGSPHATAKIYIYEDPEDLQYYEPFHIQVRNLPLEKREEIYKLKRKKEPYKHLLKIENE
ncbi:MAG: hypothetical protein ACOC44_12050 [Promethearchaeia archaeon]